MITKTKYRGKWLSLNETVGSTPGHNYEFVSRNKTSGACCVLALRQVDYDVNVILVRQFRPPIGGCIIELPAGLIDKDETPEETAKRELQEETGYFGNVVSKTMTGYSSAGMSDEQVSLVVIEITGQTGRHLDPGEDIEVLEVPLKQLHQKLQEFQKLGCAIDTKLWFLCAGMGDVSR